MSQRTQTGPMEPREGSSKPMRIIKKWKQRAQRKELVNGVGAKANKPQSKGYGNWVMETQKI